MEFNWGKCKVSNLHRTDPMQPYLEASHRESSAAERDLGVPEERKLNVSQQHVLVEKKALGLHWEEFLQSVKEASFPSTQH